MTMQPFNPLAPLFNSARQINEQANQAARTLGDSLTQSANSLLSAAAQGVPPLPGAQTGNPGPSRGNPNGGLLALPQLFPAANGGANGQLPTLQQLFPPGAVQAVSQVEEVVIPAGLPRPSQVLLGTRPRRPAAPVEEEMAPAPTPARRTAVGVEGAQPAAGIRRRSRALGVQAV